MTLEGKLIAVLAVGALLVGAYGYGRYDGTRIADGKWEKREAALNAEAAELLRVATADVLAAQQAQAAAALEELTAYYQGLEEDHAKREAAVAALVAGTARMQLPARCPGGGAPPGADPAGAPRAQDPTRAELHPEAARFLLELTGEADRNTRQLNAVIGYLEACEATVNRKGPSSPNAPSAGAPWAAVATAAPSTPADTTEPPERATAR